MMRSVLVTGGGSGIGRGIAAVLAGRGWSVVVNDIDAATAEATAKEVGGQPVPGDVGADAAGLIAGTLERTGGQLHALVNNAGIIRRASLAQVAAEQLDEVYRVNLRAVILLSQAALPHLVRAGGSVVNVSSIAAETPQTNAGLYAASKAGVSQFTRQAAVEWGPQGVRVNGVAPGMVRSAMSESVYAQQDLHQRRRALVPLGRIGTPDDIGRVVAFLLSDDAAYVTGQVIAVDGGFTQVLIDQLPHPPGA